MTAAAAFRRAARAAARKTEARIITAGDRAPDACALLFHADMARREYRAAWMQADPDGTPDYVAAAGALARLAMHCWRAHRLTAPRRPWSPPLPPATAARNAALIADDYRHRCRAACIAGANGAPPVAADWLKSYWGPPT